MFENLTCVTVRKTVECSASSLIPPGARHSRGSQKFDSTPVCSHGPGASHHQGEFVSFSELAVQQKTPGWPMIAKEEYANCNLDSKYICVCFSLGVHRLNCYYPPFPHCPLCLHSRLFCLSTWQISRYSHAHILLN